MLVDISSLVLVYIYMIHLPPKNSHEYVSPYDALDMAYVTPLSKWPWRIGQGMKEFHWAYASLKVKMQASEKPWRKCTPRKCSHSMSKCVYIYIYINVYKYVFISDMYMYVYVYMYTYICIIYNYIYIYLSTYTYIYIYTIYLFRYMYIL